jgi:ArsR family transcriptional regulator
MHMKRMSPDRIASVDADPHPAADLLRMLANEHRLRVLCALKTGELSVGRLVERVGLSQSALSQHLARLRADGVVATRRDAQTIYYRIADADVLDVLTSVARVVERRRGKGER